MRIEQRMRHERERYCCKPVTRGVADRCPPAPQGEPDQRGNAGQDKQGVAEPAVVGEVADGVTKIDEHVQVGHGPEDGAGKQSLATMFLRHTGSRDTGTKRSLRY